MKKLLAFLMVFVFTIGVFSQAPDKMSYQAVIRNSSGELVKSGSVGMQISILSGTPTGTAVYVETQSETTNENGLITLEIGAGTPVAGTFAGIDWSAGEYFLKTETDPAGGTDYSITGTSQLLSVPYALNSKTAENAYWIKNGNDISYISGKVGIGVSTPLYSLLDVAGSNQYGISWIKETTLPHTGVHEAVLYIVNNSGIANSQANISFAAGNPGHGRAIISATHDVSAGLYDGNLNFKVRNGEGTNNSTNYLTALTIRSNGYIGINESDPDAELHVTGDIHVTDNLVVDGNIKLELAPVDETDAANKKYVDALIEQLYSEGALRVRDCDGNYYNTVLIGNQIWMSENLKTSKYNDNTEISLVTDAATWKSLTTDAYCWYDNNISNKDIYGALYNWYAVNTGKLCPTGWHVPSSTEWTTADNYLIANGYNFDGTTTGNKIAKSMAAKTNWTFSATGGAVGNTDYPTYRNKTGFTAFPGGLRYSMGGSDFDYLGSSGRWWSSTESSTYGWLWYLNNGEFSSLNSTSPKGVGSSVRCIKDN